MKWVVAAFVFFGLFIGSLVVICVREDINLVSKDYYQQELNHQAKMTQQVNTNQLTDKPQLSFEDHSVKLVFPFSSSMEKGVLRVVRPSDDQLDQQFELSAMEGDSQSFTLKVWEKGLYRVSLTWTMEGKDYYFEKVMVL
ncbi:MAG: hypothetical protein RI909_71 [Bacteroidota bacterium]|jgi:hypothetical protein